MSNNILQPIPMTLNNYLLQNGETVLSNTTPAAPSGSSNITWQFDQFGNISAYTGASGGGSVGTAGQVQMVGSSTGSFAASSITDNGTSVSITEAINAFTGIPSGTQVIGLTIFENQTAGGFSFQSSDLQPGDTTLTFNPNVNGTSGIDGTMLISSCWFDPNFYFQNNSSGAGTPTFNFRFGNSTAVKFTSTLLTAPALALTAPTVATSATAGAATALPATPLGYVEATLTISGTPTVVKIPYYSV